MLNPDVLELKLRVSADSDTWLDTFSGGCVVVKFGGNAMVDDSLQVTFAQDIAFLQSLGLRPIVVHGGGPQITVALNKAGVESEFLAGLRVTSPQAIEIIRDTLLDEISRPLANLILEAGAEAAVFNGENAGLFLAEVTRGDLGLVGDVVKVAGHVLTKAISSGVVPVISSVAPDASGQLLNVNADLAAAAVAIEMKAAKLIVLTDVPGLYSNWPHLDSFVSEIRAEDLVKLMPNLESGMIPKMQACLSAVRGGVPEARIIDGRVANNVLFELFGNTASGTLVLP